MEHVGSSSLIRNQTQVPCIGSTVSYPLVHQGSPGFMVLKTNVFWATLYTFSHTVSTTTWWQGGCSPYFTSKEAQSLACERMSQSNELRASKTQGPAICTVILSSLCLGGSLGNGPQGWAQRNIQGLPRAPSRGGHRISSGDTQCMSRGRVCRHRV